MEMISANMAGTPLVHYWSKCVGAGRAKEGLRASWQEQLRTAKKECGFQYIRFHGLLNDDMFVYKKVGEKEIYNFQYIDDLYDALLAQGIRPIVELAFMPNDMAEELTDYRQFWWNANINPPKDYERWYRLIERLTRHFQERYGADEVKKWYFEVWNEPNLHNIFWSGGKSRYLKLYEYAAKAVKSVNLDFKVGGPATSNYVPDDRFLGEYDDSSKHMTHKITNLDEAQWRPVWIKEFLTYCEEKKLPVDFVSVHPYPTDFAVDGHGETTGRSRNARSTEDDLRTLRKIIENSSYNKAELILTEWSSSPSSRDYSHDTIQEAAFIMKCNIESRGLVDALSYWTFSDIFEELGAGDVPFHGGFGLINYQGIKKPSYHAYRFLNQLGDQELAVRENYIVTRSSKDEKVVVGVFNYNQELGSIPITNSYEEAQQITEKGKVDSFELNLCDLQSGSRFLVERVNSECGCAMELYRKLGYPEELSIYETQMLKRQADNTQIEVLQANDVGELMYKTQLKPWEIMIIRQL